MPNYILFPLVICLPILSWISLLATFSFALAQPDGDEISDETSLTKLFRELFTCVWLCLTVVLVGAWLGAHMYAWSHRDWKNGWLAVLDIINVVVFVVIFVPAVLRAATEQYQAEVAPSED